MIILKANTAYDIHFSTRDTDGNAADASSTPTAILFAGNTSLSGTVTVTVSSVSTGMYNASFTTPADISSYLGKTASLDISAMISTVAAKANKVIGMFDTKITSDNYAILTDGDYGLAQLVRATTPANTLDVSNTGEAGIDLSNIKQATGATTLTNITVPTVTTLTGHTPQTGDSYAVVTNATYGLSKLATAVALATVDTVVDAIKVVTDKVNSDSGQYPTVEDFWSYANRSLTDKDGFSLSDESIAAIRTVFTSNNVNLAANFTSYSISNLDNTMIQDRVRQLLRRTDLDLTNEISVILRDISGYAGLRENTATVEINTDGYAALYGITSLVGVIYNGTQLKPMSMTGLLQIPSGGDVEYYTLWSNRLFIGSRPAEPINITVLYTGYATDVNQLDENWLEALVNGVCWKAAVRLNLDANRQLLYRDYYMAELERRKNEMPVNPTFINYTELQ